MKKNILLLLAIFLASVASYAQQATATLNHNDIITTFYGIDALQQAWGKAKNGDVINLSSGYFYAPKISKPSGFIITVIGAGMASDTINNILPTRIEKQWSGDTDTLILRNLDIYQLYSTAKNINAEKCRIRDFYSSREVSYTLIGCIAEVEVIRRLNAVNSVVTVTSYTSGLSESFFDNCVIYPTTSLERSTINNSIIIDVNTSEFAFSTYNTTNNTLYVGAESYPFGGCIAGNCWTITGDENTIFKTPMYQLNDEFKDKYIGNDGKEIGIYGGTCPFTVAPHIYQILKCDVAPKTTPDGKLSVHIEVMSAE